MVSIGITLKINLLKGETLGSLHANKSLTSESNSSLFNLYPDFIEEDFDNIFAV